MKRISVLLGAVLLASLAARGVAQGKRDICAAATNDVFLGIQTIRLWQGDAPEAKGKACEDTPTLTVFSPRGGTENGSAVVILPGGSHMGLAADLEGREIADWFAARGFTAFILQYRLGSKGYIFPVPLYDARRAIQLVRARAADYHLDPHRVGIIGFSAGGHLAALAGTKFIPGDENATDPIDRASSRPDFMVLGYPWIGAISTDYSHLNYCKLMKVEDRCAALAKEYSPDLFVTKDTPPTFWYHTFDDSTVPLEQGLRFYEALLKAGVPAEAHIFAHGSHGSGLGKGIPTLDQWPQLLENWLRAQGLIPDEKR
jgi:acetyl esterase/lipase